MSERAEQLHTSAETQIVELIDLISTTDDETLHRPCPGREKLGDGTVGAMAAHTTENYQRIGSFVATSQRMTNGRSSRQRGGHRTPGSIMRVLGHTRPDEPDHQPGHRHEDRYAAENAHPKDLQRRLLIARGDLTRIAELTDRQLDAIPPKDSFRFCDGQRTLEQVLAGLLKHQDRQIQALRTALA